MLFSLNFSKEEEILKEFGNGNYTLYLERRLIFLIKERLMYPIKFGLAPCDSHYNYVLNNLTSRLQHCEARKVQVKYVYDNITEDEDDELPELMANPFEEDGKDEGIEIENGVETETLL